MNASSESKKTAPPNPAGFAAAGKTLYLDANRRHLGGQGNAMVAERRSEIFTNSPIK
jgi:hypothetical protein